MKIKVTWKPANKIHIFDTDNPPTAGRNLAIYQASINKQDVSVNIPGGNIVVRYSDLKVEELN